MVNISKIRNYFCLIITAFLTLNTNAQGYGKLTGEQYPVIAWYSIDAEHNTKEQYRRISNAGFNLALTSFLTKEEIKKALHEAKGTGVKLIVDCQESRNANLPFINEIKESPALGMYYLCDEPNKDYFETLAERQNRILNSDRIHAGYINLLPIYANKEQLKAESYSDYLDSFLSKVQVPFLSYDHYPFLRESFRDDFYTNLETVAKKCNNAGISFWGFARSYYSKEYYMIDEGRLRLQVFANMAYGAQGIQYFTYSVPKGGERAIVDSSYRKTVLYDVVKKINSEVQVVGKYSKPPIQRKVG